MADVELPNLSTVEVAESVVSLRERLANNLWTFYFGFLTLILLSFFFFNMTQINNVEDYNTDIDYGTQTQSPFATSGPNEVNFSFFLLLKTCLSCYGGKTEPGRFCTQGRPWYETHRHSDESVCLLTR